MVTTVPFKRLILRAVLRQVSPMVIRLLSVPDDMNFPEFHEVIRAVLGWNSDLGYIIRVHGQEFNSFHRKTRSQALHELKLRRQEKFLYICDTLHLWEWDTRVLDIEDGVEMTTLPVVWVAERGSPGALRGANRISVDVETTKRRCGNGRANGLRSGSSISGLPYVPTEASANCNDRLRAQPLSALFCPT